MSKSAALAVVPLKLHKTEQFCFENGLTYATMSFGKKLELNHDRRCVSRLVIPVWISTINFVSTSCFLYGNLVNHRSAAYVKSEIGIHFLISQKTTFSYEPNMLGNQVVENKNRLFKAMRINFFSKALKIQYKKAMVPKQESLTVNICKMGKKKKILHLFTKQPLFFAETPTS